MTKILNWFVSIYPLEKSTKQKKLMMHLLFWLGYTIIIFSSQLYYSPSLLKIFSSLNSVLKSAFLYYSLVYAVFPMLYHAKKYTAGTLLLLLVFIIYFYSVFYNYKITTENQLFVYTSYANKYCLNYVKNGFWAFLDYKYFLYEFSNLIYAIFPPMVIKFIRLFGQYSANIQIVASQKTDLEVYFLRSQLQPHFLFDSLNNIYKQIISKTNTAPQSIILLSNLLKHTLYNSNNKLIPLSEEINFIKDYIDFEKMKSSQPIKIQYNQEGLLDKYNIAPLILSHYIETAFKYGKATNKSVSTVSITIKVATDKLFFTVENDFLDQEKKSKVVPENDLSLQNTQKRLQIFYPQKHLLNHYINENKFKVELQLDLDIKDNNE